MTDDWILVKERLPDKSGTYLVCFLSGRMEIIEFNKDVLEDGLFPFGYWDIEYDELGHQIPDWIEMKNIKWWQPLPNLPEGCLGYAAG